MGEFLYFIEGKGIIMGLFDFLKKKNCSICGGEIGLLGNRKLEDGNMCKECAKKLSPWFSDRRNSTVAEINEQLAYREENKKAVEVFHITRTLGEDMKVLLDEDTKRFMVTRAKNVKEANPDVLEFSQVTGCSLDIDEDVSEEMTEDKDGNSVSYKPQRFTYQYHFNITLHVNHPYFNEMEFAVNSSAVDTTPNGGVPALRKPNPKLNREYKKYETMAEEIVKVFEDARMQKREEVAAAAAPTRAVTCPYCGATTTPDAKGCCEYCGGVVNG